MPESKLQKKDFRQFLAHLRKRCSNNEDIIRRATERLQSHPPGTYTAADVTNYAEAAHSAAASSRTHKAQLSRSIH